MQRPILTQIKHGDRTYQVRAAYNGKFEVFVVNEKTGHAVQQSMHDTMEQAQAAIIEYAKRRGIS